MYALSAVDAVVPAVRRTSDFLFRPFHLSTYLKLCLVACVTEGIGGFSGTYQHASHHHSRLALSAFNPAAMLTPARLTIILAATLIGIVLGCVVAYLVTRLRFAYFHCLAHNTREIKPGWRLYRAQAMRFFWMSLTVGLCFLLVVALIALPFIAGFWRLFHHLPPDGHFPIGAFLALFLPLIPVGILLIFAGIAVDLILRDFLLPHFALENATARDAWRMAWARIQPEKSSFFLYAVLRIVLPIAAMIALLVVLIIPLILSGAAIVFAELALHAAVSHATSTVAFFGLGLQILIGAIALGIALLLTIALSGPVSTAKREYALLFYGARYQPLANILWPPRAATPAPEAI